MSAQQPQQPQETQTIPRPNRWPLLIMPLNRYEATNKDAKLVNGFMEKELTGDSWLYKRPGLAKSTQPSGGAGLGQGTYNWLSDVYSIFSGHLYKNGTDVGGSINTEGGVYRFTSIMGEVPKLVFENGIKLFSYCDSLGLQDWTSSLPFTPPFFKGPVFLDDFLFIMAPFAHIYNNDVENILDDWVEDSVMVARIEPTRGVALAKQLVYLIAFKEDSTEVFYDAGNADDTPLGRIQGAKVNFGCVNADSVREIDGALFWLCTNRSSEVQVIKMDNLKPEIISTPAIEKLLSVADFSVILSWTLKFGGHRWYGFTIKNNNLTLVYDMTTGLWSQWTDGDGNYLPIVDSTYRTQTAQTLLQHETNGWLYTVDFAHTMEEDKPITVDIYTPNYDAGTMRDKTVPAMYFDTSQDAGSILQIRWSDDDYRTWSSYRQLDLGQKKPRLDNTGTFRRRALNLRHQSDTRFRIRAVDFQMDIGQL